MDAPDAKGRATEVTQEQERENPMLLQEKLDLLVNANPEGCNQYKDCGGGAVSPPKTLPAEGKVEYMGFKLSKFEGTNVGYGGATHTIDTRKYHMGKIVSGTFDASKHQLHESTRKVSGVETEYPDGGSKIHPSLKAAIKYIHQWHGIG